MSKVKVYVKPFCPFCVRVTRYLTQNNIDFEEIDVSYTPDVYEHLKRQTNHMTVPQIFINDKFIGGSDEFFQLISNKEENFLL